MLATLCWMTLVSNVLICDLPARESVIIKDYLAYKQAAYAGLIDQGYSEPFIIKPTDKDWQAALEASFRSLNDSSEGSR